MTDCKNLKDLRAEIQKKVVEAMKTDVSNKVELIEHEEVKKVVLDTYSPKVYKRRDEHHGIEAVENMKAEVQSFDGEIKLSVVNNTPVDDPSHNYRLDEAIVEGGYSFEYPVENRDIDIYTYLKGRDFITATQDRVNSSGEVKEALKRALIRQGLKVNGK